MEEKIDKAIETLAAKITPAIRADDALKFAQATMNLVNVKSTLFTMDRESPTKRQRASA